MSTILIVEDDVNINEMLKVALQKEGYSCIQAFSGTEGRLVLSQEEPDLVLLDLMLPGMSGETLSGGDPADKAGGTGHCPVGQR